MIRGRWRILNGSGMPGDPGGSPGNFPNPPNDPSTRGTNDPGGFGGPVSTPTTDPLFPSGFVACSRYHQISIQNIPASVFGVDHFAGLHTVEHVADYEWRYDFPAPHVGDSIVITIDGTTLEWLAQLWLFSGSPQLLAQFRGVATHCPGQSMYPLDPPNDRGLGDMSGTTCSVG